MDSKPLYRNDIDGLRAIAVIVVILNHFYMDFMPSGFLGVDIFFVISGYVITQSLVSIRSESWFDYLTNFYARRVRRLLPALVFCIVVSAALFIFFTADPAREIFVTGGLSLFGLSNMYLLKKSSDYFSLDAQLNPFTHTWSLGVEEQFYFVYPALIALCGFVFVARERAYIWALVVLSVLSVASFLLYVVLFYTQPMSAFYLMPTRFWEFCVGGLVFLALAKFGRAFVPTQTVSICSVFALLVLCLLFFMPVVFQFYSTVLAVLATGVLIFTVTSGQGVNNILCSRPFLFFGALSYSLYLWHWPILVLGKYTIGSSLAASIVLLITVLLLSVFSYYYIEKPLRYSQALEGRLKPLFLVLFFVLPAAYLVIREVPDIPASRVNFASFLGVEKVQSWAGSVPCHGANKDAQDNDFVIECLRPERSIEHPRAIFLLGDSHAAQLTFMLNKAMAGYPFEVRFAHSAHDRDFPRGFLSGINNALTLDYVLEHSREGDVVAISVHRGRLNADRDKHISLSQNVADNDRSRGYLSGLSSYVQRFSQQGVAVVLIKDTPLMSVVATSEACRLQLKLFDESVCRVNREQDLHTRKRQDRVYDRLASEYSNVYVWDPAQFMYSEAEYVDVIDEAGEYVMMDAHHITRYQSEKLAKHFSHFFDEKVIK